MSVTGGIRWDEKGDQRHSTELQPDGLTHLNVDLVQQGVACVNSWGALPRPEHMVTPQEYEFSFVIKPVL